MDLLESVLVDMGVNLGGCNVSMAEHELHGAQVSPMGQEMGGKRVAKHVR